MEDFELSEEIKKKERLGSCEVCTLKPSLYTCPKCELKTCSLTCIRIHKKELNCDGIRDRTKYKPLKQMTAMDFMNDYYFLEEASRFTKEIKSNPTVKSQHRLNLRFVKLRKEALNRNIRLYFLNNGLTKRKRNQSMYKSQERAIYWFVELIFTNASSLSACRKFNENTKVQDILTATMDTGDEQRTKDFEFYRAEGEHKLRVFLKSEGLRNNRNRYYEMDLRKSLKANLSGKVIIEYPTFHVVLSHSADGYELVPTDDESIEVELKDFRKTLHEEVFSKKIGQNPPLIRKPEEVPISEEVPIAELVDDTQNLQKPITKCLREGKAEDSDDEVQPENYFF